MGALTANLRFLNGYANSSTGIFPEWFDATGITEFTLDNQSALSAAIPNGDTFFSTADLNIVSEEQVEWSLGSTMVTLSGSGVEGLLDLEPENISTALNVNLSEPNDDLQQMIIDAGAGEDEVGLRLTEAMISNQTEVSFQGGADYDTIKINEDDHGREGYEIEVDFDAGEITYTKSEEALYTAKFADFERVRVVTESDLFAYGSDSDDVLRYDGYGAFEFIDDSTTDTDRLELHRFRTKAGNGLTLDELLELVNISRADDGSVVLSSTKDGSTWATLKNIEYIRLMTDREADETRDYSIQELLTIPINETGTDGNDELQGLAGNDTLFGLEGDDTLIGGAGDDRLEPGTGNDRAYGQDGNDTIIGVDSDISAIGGSGDDLIDFSGITTGYGGWAEPGSGQNTVIGSQTVWDAGEGGGLSYADIEDAGGVVLRVGQDGSGTVTSATAGLVNDTFSYMTNFFGSQG